MKDERGITLVELLVVLAITGLIIGILATVIFQIFDITGWGNRELVVQHDLQNAATWLNRDVLTASRAEVSGSQMVLEVPYYNTAVADFLTRTITYTLSGDELLREDASGSTLVLARYVDPSRFSFSPTDIVTAPNVITVTLFSKEGDVRGSGTFALKMRAGGSIAATHLCQVTGADHLDIHAPSKTVRWDITNNGQTSPSIDELYITWPITNGRLGLINFRTITNTIWADEWPSPPATINENWLGNREIYNGTQWLEFSFESVLVDEDLYSITITLTDKCAFSFPPNP